MRCIKFVLVPLLVLAFTGPARLAAQTSVALGENGQLHRLVTATYAELFGDSDAAEADTPVLALETSSSFDGEIGRVLVPGTEDSRIEIEPRIFQDPKLATIVVLWRSQSEETGEDTNTLFRFATFDGTEWSEVHTLENDGLPLSVASRPLIAETRDAFELDLLDGIVLNAERRILHLLWQSAEEIPTTYYAPLSFVEGHYLGRHGVLSLSEAFLLEPETSDGSDETQEDDSADGSGTDGDDPDGDAPETIDLSPTLGQTLNLQPASDERSVLVTFANLESQRLGTLEIHPLPLELGMLGEQIRDQLLALADLYNPEDPTALSDEMRAAVIVIGLHFNLHQAHSDYVANQVADWIMESGSSYGWSDFERLGNDAMQLAIDVSNEVFASTRIDPADPDSEIVEINIAGLFGELDEPDPAQTIDILVRSNLPAPAIGEGLTTLYTSRSGDRQLVAWEDEESGVIQWVESLRQGTWSEPFSLSIDDSLTLDEAHRLLAAKVR